MRSVIRLESVSAGYGQLSVVRDLDLEVLAGEVVALIGPNGAGKTTTLLTIAGELRPLGGRIELFGKEANGQLHRRARDGLTLITEERSVFFSLSVRQNIELAGCSVPAVTALFPELEPLIDRRVGLLSGGEQQMLAVARSLANSRMRALMIDELSLGLAPRIVTRLLGAVRAAADRNVGVLLVEQHVERALEVSDRVCVVAQGEMKFWGTVDDLRNDASRRASLLNWLKVDDVA